MCTSKKKAKDKGRCHNRVRLDIKLDKQASKQAVIRFRGVYYQYEYLFKIEMDVMILGSNELERIPYASGQTPSHEIWFNLLYQPYSSSRTKNTNIFALF